jgi:hypothetical protein
MDRFVLLASLLFFTLICEPIVAQPISNDSFVAASLYSGCTHSVKDARTKADQDFLEQTCTTYLRGLTDALFVMQSLQSRGTKTCLPTDAAITIVEARSVFQAYLANHPKDVGNSAGLIAAMSLVAAHKCRS